MDISALSTDTIIQYVRIVIDILLVWILINYIIKVARTNQKTIQLFHGVFFILVIQALAKFFGLTTVAYITDNIVSWGVLAIIVIFQPEIRSILERLGKSNALARISVLSKNEKERLVDELVTATATLSASKTGALITLEQSTFLNEYIATGVQVNSVVSAELLCSIFQTTTPLHDGAVIIQGDRLACASAYFPPTNMDLPSRYGARHRAAIGISEVTDAVTIVVSEESGRVAVTTGGKILQMNEHKLRAFLEKIILSKETVHEKSSTVTASKSVSVDTLLPSDGSSDEELEFRVADAPVSEYEKQLKTFQSADFKSMVEEAETNYQKQNKQNVPAVSKAFEQTSSNPVVKKVVKEIVDERTMELKALKAESEKPEIKIRTVSVPRDTIVDPRPKQEIDADAVIGTIKTQKVIDGASTPEENKPQNDEGGSVNG